MLQEIVGAYLVLLLWDVLAKKYNFIIKPYEVFETAKGHVLYFYPKSQSIQSPAHMQTPAPPEITIDRPEHNDDACMIAIFLWIISLFCLSNTRNRRSHHHRHLRRNSPGINR